MNSGSRESEGSDGSYSISEIDTVFTEEDLSEEGFVLSNLVGSLRLNRQLDLEALTSDLENTEYHPETYPSMIYRPFGSESSVSVLTPSSGKLAIVGAKSKQELREGTEKFLKALINLGIEVDTSTDNILIQNIVANYDLNVELDLSVVALSLDLENVEYEPEQFPGLIYRTTNNSTVLVFGSGKSVITGANTYEDIINSRDEVEEKLRDIGVERL
jgi:transcription initiation factor TFIID TATA-box-binding protein